jgi:drug/metabolite transporter (DMT)-like permease
VNDSSDIRPRADAKLRKYSGWTRAWSALRQTGQSGYVLMALAALGFSFKSILVKLIYENYENDAITIVLMRIYLGTPLFVLALLLMEGFQSLRTNLRELATFALMGIVGLGGATYFSFLAIASLGASVGTLVVFSYPAMTILMLAVLDRRVVPTQLVALGLAGAGLVLVVLPGGTLAVDLTGILAGLVSAFCFAAYNVMIDRGDRSTSPVRQAAFSMTLLTIFATLAFGHREYPAALEAWTLTGTLAIFAGFVPFLFFLYGIRKIGAGPGTIANLMGPAFNLVWAYLIFGELLNLWQLGGVALIFGGVATLKARLPGALLRLLLRRIKISAPVATVAPDETT